MKGGGGHNSSLVDEEKVTSLWLVGANYGCGRIISRYLETNFCWWF